MYGTASASAPKGTNVTSQHGPADALHPIGDLEVLTHTQSGVHVIRQGYADGHIYEYMIPKGVAIDPETSYFAIPFFQGRVLRTFGEGDFNYVCVWVPEKDEAVFGEVFDEAVQMPDFDYASASEAKAELLHEDERVSVSRLRLATGWLYIVDIQFGFPWPSFYTVSALMATRTAPIVSVDRTGTSFLSKFWVADNSAPVSP
jgi:hypothetical protein